MQPIEMEIDLNDLIHQHDDNPQEVILNPAQPQGEFLELNDLLEGNKVVEEVIIAQNLQNNILPPMLPEEQQLLQVADDFQQNEPQLPVIPANALDENIMEEEVVPQQ